jgi:hypothetical protein
MSIPKAYYITLRFGTVKALAGWLAREAEGLVDQAFRRVTQVSARSQPGGLGPCSAWPLSGKCGVRGGGLAHDGRCLPLHHRSGRTRKTRHAGRTADDARDDMPAGGPASDQLACGPDPDGYGLRGDAG